MKTFFKVLGTVISIIGAVIGALAIFEKLTKKNYLLCDSPENEE